MLDTIFLGQEQLLLAFPPTLTTDCTAFVQRWTRVERWSARVTKSAYSTFRVCQCVAVRPCTIAVASNVVQSALSAAARTGTSVFYASTSAPPTDDCAYYIVERAEALTLLLLPQRRPRSTG